MACAIRGVQNPVLRGSGATVFPFSEARSFGGRERKSKSQKSKRKVGDEKEDLPAAGWTWGGCLSDFSALSEL